jgi:DNA-binding HxlR family transcriptional regulator
MAHRQGYGQYCPIAVTAEVIAQRWTPLVIRALCMGATRFNEIHDSVPRMSSALLAQRLRELEGTGIIERFAAASGRGRQYRLTEAGRELFPVLEGMGMWSQRWLRHEITRDENLDPYVLFWDIRHSIIAADLRIDRRRVAKFHLDGVASSRRFYWLVLDPDDVDVCVIDPGHDVDLWVSAHIRTLVEVWLGHRALSTAIEDGSLRLDGSREELGAFRRWFCLSHFAEAGRAATMHE